MPRRPVLAAFAASLALAAGASACGSTGGPTGPASPPPPRIGAIAIDPPAGPVGTTFTLTAGGLKEGQAVAFEITFPGQGKAYPGAAINVPPDGTATTSYRATTANQPGDYLVRLTGPPGSLAEGKFTVTDGPPIDGAVPNEPTTSTPASTIRTGTTRRYGITTTIKGGSSTTATTVKGSSTTTTVHTTTITRATTTTKKP